jgi:hypothetical protein
MRGEKMRSKDSAILGGKGSVAKSRRWVPDGTDGSP